MIRDNPAVDHSYTYVWKNEQGIPKGVIGYHKEYSEKYPGGLMLVEAFYFADEEGLKGLFNHIRAYRGHFQSVRLSLPRHIALQRVLPEVSGCAFHRTLYFNGMGRVIHAENALRMAHYRGNGTVSIRLTDRFIKENNRVFQVTFENGHCISVEDGASADIELDIGTFSRWILGCLDAEEVKDEKLKKVFYPKKNYICNGF